MLPTLLMAAAALLISLTVFGLEPAIQLTRARDVSGELAETAGGLGAPKAKRQRVLLRWQVAVSTGFFILASLFVRFASSKSVTTPASRSTASPSRR